MAKKPTPVTTTPTVRSEEERTADVADAAAKGFVGRAVDPTPNEHYTVDGVLAGKPTPDASDGRPAFQLDLDHPQGG